ncbi:cytochrome P450 [Streptomyces sp. NPDC015346]|uniref:cytochrome P450 n=1 Tax=Streptomyces sp. NPDC015346 TaxID=3364954 RepID=UPI0036FDCA13
MTEKLRSQPLAATAAPPILFGRFLIGPRYMKRRFARHGEIVPSWEPGVGRAVWLRDPHLIEQVLRSPAAESNTLGRLLGRALGSTTMLNQLSGEQHHTVRRLMIPTMRGDALPRCQEATAAAAQRMANACPLDKPFRLLPLLAAAVAEANVRACVGVDDPHLLRTWVKTVLRLRKTSTHPLVVAYSLGALPWNPMAHWARRDCIDLVRQEVARRRRAGAAHDDALGHLLTSAGEELTDDVLCDQTVFYLLAGQVTALAAAWVIERAVRQPHIWERLTAEASAQDNDAPYTDAVVREALRLRPPLTVIPWLLHEPCEIGSYQVPAGTYVVASLWDLHRHPDLYPDPEAFRPERFLQVRPPRGTWLPFGVGPHACIGGQLALLQVKVLLHALIGRGHLLPALRRDEGIGHRSSTETHPAQGCRVILRPPSPRRNR